ncbi:MAG: phosphoenolpyruvate--protein phosphotransferase, partial [Proteobacteria bacterium]|nr:phosphoenolpyruvate--protein phosphotransferase [Pseudomonadota bacterium]
MNIIPENIELKGIGIKEGIVIGRAFVLSDQRVIVSRKKIVKQQVEIEKSRFYQAIEKTKKELFQIKQDLLKKEKLKEYASIISAHIEMLNDKIIVDKTINKIEKKLINAEWAFSIVINRLIEHFEEIDDPYIRERKYDLEHLRNKVLKNFSGYHFGEPDKIKFDVVLIAHDLSPSDTARLNPEKIKAIVTEKGSITSHTAIIAKALGIPAIVAVETLLTKVTGGDLLIVDGKSGKIIINPDNQTIELYKNKQRDEELKKQKIYSNYLRIPAKTIDNVRIVLKANIEIPEEVHLVKKLGCDGIGLYRTEFLFLNRSEPPTEDEHYNIYKSVADEVYPKEVTIRTFDLGGEKIGYHHLKIHEKNPALGIRAIRFCLQEKQLFLDQVCGILRANEKGNVRILFPLVSNLEEVKNIKHIINEAKERLKRKKILINEKIKIGIMIEVPSAALMADILSKEVDFFSVGTNDLIQYAIAIDRSNEYVAHLYDPMNISIVRLLDFILASAKKRGIEVNICGEMAGESKYVPLLLALGFRELSMNPNALPIVRKTISSLNMSVLQELIDNIR